MSITITTNGQARELLSVNEVPADAAGDFDYITGEDRWSPRLFQYRGEWYDTGEFEVTKVAGWHGQQPDTMWTAILVRYTDDFQCVVVGRAVISD